MTLQVCCKACDLEPPRREVALDEEPSASEEYVQFHRGCHLQPRGLGVDHSTIGRSTIQQLGVGI